MKTVTQEQAQQSQEQDVESVGSRGVHIKMGTMGEGK